MCIIQNSRGSKGSIGSQQADGVEGASSEGLQLEDDANGRIQSEDLVEIEGVGDRGQQMDWWGCGR